MRVIKLTNNKNVLVDSEDYKSLSQFTWMQHSRGYAYRKVYLGKINGKYKWENVFMHRQILNTPKKLVTDHINHNVLDNRKSNIRICTQGENMRNQKLAKNNKSGIKGVFWMKEINKWVASITVKDKYITLGYFKNKQHACLARKWGEKLYHGEYALNIWKAN